MFFVKFNSKVEISLRKMTKEETIMTKVYAETIILLVCYAPSILTCSRNFFPRFGFSNGLDAEGGGRVERLFAQGRRA